MGWFDSDTDAYVVTAQHQGWLGWSKVTKRVTGRRASGSPVDASWLP